VSAQPRKSGIRLKLPATSANLGPGFDAVGLALSMHLTVEAWPADEFSIEATGRDASLCGKLDGNLIVDSYRRIARDVGADFPALRLKIHNEIPLGMGCGSSAAAICAAVALADHFGPVIGMKHGDAACVGQATVIEGHPDNVAACWHGGFTVSAQDATEVRSATFSGDPEWKLMLAIPSGSLSTNVARALLPDIYSRVDAVFNLQRVGLLTAAFAQSRLDLLGSAMQDRMHQPYRMEACPMLAKLLPLATEPWIAGVALSGAGPSVLVFLNSDVTPLEEMKLRASAGRDIEWLSLQIATGVEKTLL
jgi:homoserine kinase